MRASGIGTYLRSVIPRVIAARPDWHFTLLGRSEELQGLPWVGADHVTVIPCHAKVYGIAEQIQLARCIPPGTDLVWSPHYNIPLSYRGRLLVTLNDVCHLALPHLFKGAHRRAYARLMLSRVQRRASRILCPSEFTVAEFRHLVGGSDQTLAMVPLGVDARWFEVQAAGRPHPKPFLLFVGNVKPHKNLGTLINAFHSLAGLIPHDLVLVGKQSGFITGDGSALRAAAALGDRVRLTGEVSTEQLEQFFAHADAFVFPSLYEGFGLPPLEAMACGCPTVVSSAGALPEVCGNASLYFTATDSGELASTIVRVLSNDQVRQDLRQRGRRHAAQFSWDRCGEQTLGFLEELTLV
jgi:glycosyltransferase involved in cell wall biosynthesis